MIPKRIFFFWSAGKMSWLRYMTLKSFRHYNPDWQIDLYVCPDNKMKKVWKQYNQQDFFAYKGKDYFGKVKELGINIIPWEIRDTKGKSWAHKVAPSQKSNFFKWQTLYQEGGIYADMDILWTAPFDSYYNSLKGKTMSICYRNHMFSIGLLASQKGCEFYGDVWKNGFTCFHKGRYQTAGVMNVYNLLAKKTNKNIRQYSRMTSMKDVKNLYPDINVHNIPMSLVYPWIHTQIDNYWRKELKHENLPKGTIGLHWYAGHPDAQRSNNRMNEDSIGGYDNTISHWAEKVL